MPLYRVLTNQNHLQPFRAIELGEYYQERDLEDWLELNPQVLVADEPLLMIGRQVSTPVGIVDLLALDVDGTVVIIELKRAPQQREAIAQVLEYASWFSELHDLDIRQIAEAYFVRRQTGLTFEQTWQQTFNTEFQGTILNQQHRVLVVIEGGNERMESVTRYLRKAGLDISLLTYSYYRTESSEEILLINKEVGDDETISENKSSLIPSESELVGGWQSNVQEAFGIFRDLMNKANITYKVKRTQISFNKQTSAGSTFICGFQGSSENFMLWIRADSMQSRFDFSSVADIIKAKVTSNVSVWHTSTWFILTYPASYENGKAAAEIIVNEIAEKLSQNSSVT